MARQKSYTGLIERIPGTMPGLIIKLRCKHEKEINIFKKGIINFLISQRPEKQGYEGINTLFRSAVLREKIEKNKIMIPIDVITKENLCYY